MVLQKCNDHSRVDTTQVFKFNPSSLFVQDMSEEKIEVIAYSGYRDEETPRAILFHSERIEVVEILERWIEEGSEDRSRKRFFRIKGSDRAVHLIYYDEKVMEWFRRGAHPE